MENSIKKLIREYKSKMLLEDKNSIKVTQIDEVVKSSNPILNIMSKVEKEVIERYQPIISKLRLYSIDTKPVHSRVGGYSIDRINIKNDLIKIVSVHHACGDSWFSTAKIPLSYFNMDEEEIRNAHGKWCEDYFVNGIAKAKTDLIKRKTDEISELKKEIGELK